MNNFGEHEEDEENGVLSGLIMIACDVLADKIDEQRHQGVHTIHQPAK